MHPACVWCLCSILSYISTKQSEFWVSLRLCIRHRPTGPWHSRSFRVLLNNEYTKSIHGLTNTPPSEESRVSHFFHLWTHQYSPFWTATRLTFLYLWSISLLRKDTALPSSAWCVFLRATTIFTTRPLTITQCQTTKQTGIIFCDV
jgi:hypothetical protein